MMYVSFALYAAPADYLPPLVPCDYIVAHLQDVVNFAVVCAIVLPKWPAGLTVIDQTYFSFVASVTDFMLVDL